MRQEELKVLLRQMTVKEKIGQLVQVTPYFFKEVEGTGVTTGLMGNYEIHGDDIYDIGSVLGSYDREEIISIQKAYMKKNRLGIPLLFMADVIHGIHTIFPIPLALASSFDLTRAEEMASWSAKESQRSGVHLTFSPMVDLVHDPRWGRVMEGTGEDSYLNAAFGRAFVKGYQGKTGEFATNYEKIAACAKHFIGYGAVEAGREYNAVSIERLNLYQNYLPAFQAVIDEGVAMVMTSFNTLDGIPSTGNAHLLQNILRDELAFEGSVIADWGAVGQLITHGVAEGKKEAAKLALSSGCDIDMMTDCYYEHAEELLLENQLTMEQLDQAVFRVLQLKADLGLFEDPYRGAQEDGAANFILGEEINQKSLEIAKDSIVLMQNKEAILPIESTKKVALIGPKAASQDVLGAWLGYGKQEHAISLATGMEQQFADLEIVPMASVYQVTAQERDLAIEAAKNCEVVVLALGEESDETGEGASKSDIRIDESQRDLLRAIKEVNPNIVTVLFNGRPLDLRDVTEHSKAILETWFLGTQAGTAIAETLVGKNNPSGKLPMSFPHSVGQIPIYYNHMNTGNPLTEARKNDKYISKYMDAPNEPLFPFGYGLSYTSFEVTTDFQLVESKLEEFSLQVKVNVKNTGEFAGAEVVQLYLRDRVGQVVRPVKELKRFEKVFLEKNATSEIEFSLTKEDLLYYNTKLELVADAGWFDIFVGTDSNAPKIGEFYLEK